jgi:hypothetical protein
MRGIASEAYGYLDLVNVGESSSSVLNQPNIAPKVAMSPSLGFFNGTDSSDLRLPDIVG